jgi:hypothetical protein
MAKKTPTYEPEVDNLYPNDGTYFTLSTPQDQVDEQTKQDKQAEKVAPLLKESIDRLKERIDFYKTIDAIDEDVLLEPELFMHVIAANKIVVQILSAERRILQNLYVEHIEE